jgi:hypothetical protein
VGSAVGWGWREERQGWRVLGGFRGWGTNPLGFHPIDGESEGTGVSIADEQADFLDLRQIQRRTFESPSVVAGDEGGEGHSDLDPLARLRRKIRTAGNPRSAVPRVGGNPELIRPAVALHAQHHFFGGAEVVLSRLRPRRGEAAIVLQSKRAREMHHSVADLRPALRQAGDGMADSSDRVESIVGKAGVFMEVAHRSTREPASQP